MLNNFTFTLYEVVGYLLPGGVVLMGLALLYWALFVPAVPLGVGGFQPSLGTWTLIVSVAYVLGHAVQGVGNKLTERVENSTYSMKMVKWISQRALRDSGKTCCCAQRGN